MPASPPPRMATRIVVGEGSFILAVSLATEELVDSTLIEL